MSSECDQLLLSGGGEIANLDRPTPSRSSPTPRLRWCRLCFPRRLAPARLAPKIPPDSLLENHVLARARTRAALPGHLCCLWSCSFAYSPCRLSKCKRILLRAARGFRRSSSSWAHEQPIVSSA